MATTSEFGERSQMPKPRHPNETPVIIHIHARLSPQQLSAQWNKREQTK